MPITVPISDADWFASPYNWDSDGAGALGANGIRGSSTKARTRNCGAYISPPRFNILGSSSQVKLNLDTSRLSGISSANCPLCHWNAISFDNMVIQTVGGTFQLSPSGATQQVSLGNNSTFGSIGWQLKVTFDAVDGMGPGGVDDQGNRWDDVATGVSEVSVTGLELPDGSATAAHIWRRPGRVLFIGDSLLENLNGIDGGYNLSSMSARQSYATAIASGLDAEWGVLGWSSQPLVGSNGKGNVPPVVAGSTHLNYSAGRSRLVAGALFPVADHVVICHGTNGSTEAGLGAALTSLLTSMRSVAGSNCWIWTLLPPWGKSNSFALTASQSLEAGYDAYMTANPSDERTHYLDFSASASPPDLFYSVGEDTSNNTHMLGRGAGRYAGMILKMMGDIMTPYATQDPPGDGFGPWVGASPFIRGAR